MSFLYQAITLCQDCGGHVMRWLDSLGHEDTTHANDYPQALPAGIAHPAAVLDCAYCREPIRHTHGGVDGEQI